MSTSLIMTCIPLLSSVYLPPISGDRTIAEMREAIQGEYENYQTIDQQGREKPLHHTAF